VKKNPFWHRWDQTGVGELMNMACKLGPREPVRPSSWASAAEHGGDPDSVKFLPIASG